ncbi:bifunctional lytic transglycosylase/C40 family peptidase [Listeria ilorinensis]|uniref:bifunctional lytic transglycosylase/C40 family peptidase n=1 Tax=Listeria ilorinensis TaxID=2867439 RepID=UPI001EF4EA06|nr:bifunctional lytic transglycosylase/C40 family peptidase [Listeria ilorinensis]
MIYLKYLKWALIPTLLGVGIFGLILFGTVVMLGDGSKGNEEVPSISIGLPEETLKYKPIVEKYCKEYGISEYVDYVLAIMAVESGGKGNDVMQASESLGLPPNTLQPESSIKQGCKYFSEQVKACEENGCDILTAVQSYNFGGGFVGFVSEKGGKYSLDLAKEFSKEKSGGKKVSYSNPVADPDFWRYGYGNMYYVKLVQQYLNPASFDDETVSKVMNEALKYQGYPYVFGGSTPSSSFDCSGLTQWCYGTVGINLPRTAQQQYDATKHHDLKDGKPGDLVFFTGTYNSGTYITHVGIYVGNNKMYHAGDPIGYADLNNSYWQSHIVGVGRIE